MIGKLEFEFQGEYVLIGNGKSAFVCRTWNKLSRIKCRSAILGDSRKPAGIT